MPKRRDWFTKRRVRPGFRTRIIVPQSGARPVLVPGGDALRPSGKDPQWFVMHRRGVRRPLVGEDPLEARAVSEAVFNGFLHERIMYAFLVKLGFQPGVDFTAQSSLEGGRLELGGLVADFLFFNMRLIIRVQGPYHSGFLQGKKDEEQKGILEEMGFTVIDIGIDTIASEYSLEEWGRRAFNLASGVGGSGGAMGPHDFAEEPPMDSNLIEAIWDELVYIRQGVDRVYVEYV